jgi:hypothetical protein
LSYKGLDTYTVVVERAGAGPAGGGEGDSDDSSHGGVRLEVCVGWKIATQDVVLVLLRWMFGERREITATYYELCVWPCMASSSKTNVQKLVETESPESSLCETSHTGQPCDMALMVR